MRRYYELKISSKQEETLIRGENHFRNQEGIKTRVANVTKGYGISW